MLQTYRHHIVTGQINGNTIPPRSQVQVKLAQGDITVQVGEQVPQGKPNTYKITGVVAQSLADYPDLCRACPETVTFLDEQTAELAFKPI